MAAGPSGFSGQGALSTVVNSPYIDELMLAQPGSIAASNSAQSSGRQDALLQAWAKRSKMKDWERELFESHAKKDLNEYTSTAKEYCSRFQHESWSYKVVKLIEPVFETMKLYEPHASNTIQTLPNPASPVLGGIMCILQVSANYGQYQERIAQMLSKMGDRASILVQYDREIYHTDRPVQDALIEVYGDILDFARGALGLLYDEGRPRSSLKLWGLSLWKPFELKLGPIVARFDSHLDVFEKKATACDRRRQQIMNTFHVQNAAAQQRDLAATFSAAQAIGQGMRDLNLAIQGWSELQQKNYERDRIRDEIEESRVKRELLEKKKDAVISWLPSTQWINDHEEACTKHLEGTGQWLREDPIYESWKQSDSPSLLWINGKPGCGKSVLAALTISDVKVKEDSTVGVAYVYCRTVGSAINNYIVLLSTLLKQLCLTASNIDDIYADVSDRLKTGQDPGKPKIEMMFLQILSQFSQTFIVVDGLDECPEYEEFAKFLSKMAQSSASPIKIAVFSRPNYEAIQKAFKDYKFLEVDSGANEEDIRTYISNIVTLDKIPVGKDEKTLKAVKETLLSKSNGMFLWVELLFKTLKQKRTANQVLKTLDSVPKDLEGLYELCLERIWSQGFDVDTAMKILLWTLKAKRALSWEEMAEAVAIDTESRILDDGDKITSLNQLTEICADLIRVNNEGCLELIHLSLQSYLLSNPENPSDAFKAFRASQETAQRTMAATCLTYLLLDRFNCGPASTIEELQLLQAENPFLKYAGAYWANHIGTSEAKVLHDLITELLYSEEHRELSMQHFLQLKKEPLAPFKGKSTPLHFLSMFGLEDFTRTQPQVLSARFNIDGFGMLPLDYALMARSKPMALLLLNVPENENSPSMPELGESSPLHMAAKCDWPDVIDKLLARGYNPEIRANGGLTPLMVAVQYNNLASVKRLLAAKVDVNSADEDGDTALMFATTHEYPDLVETLLDAGADVHVANSAGVTPLHLAAQNGNVHIAKSLIRNGAKVAVRAKGDDNKVPLHIASGHGALDVAKLLLEENASPDARFDGNRTALHVASFYGHLELVRLLAARFAAIDASDDDGRTSLHFAAQEGHSSILEFLLDSGASVEVEDNDGDTPLHLAVFNGHVESVKPLLQRGADPNSQGSKGWTPLCTSMVSYPNVSKMLLEHNADPNVRTNFEDRALHFAAFFGRSHLIEPLLKAHADLDAVNSRHQTALHISSAQGHTQFVKELFQHCPSLNADLKDKIGRTSLHLAAGHGRDEVIHFLLQKGASQAPDNSGDLPFHLAAHFGHEKAVKLLLTKKNLNARGDEGWTPLSSALRRGHLDISNWLLAQGANANTADKFGRTPVHIAVTVGNTDFVKKLLEAGCDGLAVDYLGRTPFYYAVDSHNMELVELFLEWRFDGSKILSEWGDSALFAASRHGDEVMLRRLVELGTDYLLIEDITGRTALHDAAISGNCQVIDYLVSIGVDPNRLDRHNCSALMYAAKKRYLEFVKKLLELKVDVDPIDKFSGMTPLHYAAANGATDTCRHLVEAGADPSVRDMSGKNAFDHAANHAPTLEQLGTESSNCGSLSIAARRQSRALVSVHSYIQALLCTEDSLNEKYLWDRLDIMGNLARGLVSVTASSKFDSKAALCLAEIVFPPSTAFDTVEVSCDMCRTRLQTLLFVCKACFDTNLCNWCWNAYDSKSEKRNITLEGFQAIEKLEKSVGRVRRAVEKCYRVNELFAVSSLIYFAMTNKWIDDKLKEYEEWNEEYNHSAQFKDYPLVGRDFLKHVRDVEAIIDTLDDDGVNLASIEVQLADIKKRRLKLERKSRPGVEFVDWVCQGHDYFQVSEEAWDKAKDDGSVDKATGRLTNAWLESLLQELSQEPNDRPNEKDAADDLNTNLPQNRSNKPPTPTEAAKNTLEIPKTGGLPAPETDLHATNGINRANIIPLMSNPTLSRKARSFPLADQSPNFLRAVTFPVDPEASKVHRQNSLPMHNLPRSTSKIPIPTIQNMTEAGERTNSDLQVNPLTSPVGEILGNLVEQRPLQMRSESKEQISITPYTFIDISRGGDKQPTDISEKSWTWLSQEENNVETKKRIVTLKYNRRDLSQLGLVFALDFANIIDEGYLVEQDDAEAFKEELELEFK